MRLNKNALKTPGPQVKQRRKKEEGKVIKYSSIHRKHVQLKSLYAISLQN